MGKSDLLIIFGVYFVAFFIPGVYYLAIANNYKHVWDSAILKRGDIYTETSCTKSKSGHTSCSDTYYIEEIFQKELINPSTCTVQRLTPFYIKGNANRFVDSMELGTTREIYETTYSSGVCFDNKIRYQWNVYGGVFLGLALLPIALPLLYYIYLFLFGICFCCSEEKKNSSIELQRV